MTATAPFAASDARPAAGLLPLVTTPNRKVREPELVEHVACYAAERGDAALEPFCNDALDSALDEELVLELEQRGGAL